MQVLDTSNSNILSCQHVVAHVILKDYANFVPEVFHL